MKIEYWTADLDSNHRARVAYFPDTPAMGYQWRVLSLCGWERRGVATSLAEAQSAVLKAVQEHQAPLSN